MYRLKQKPEDFIVNEIADHESGDVGEYALYLMKKKDMNTVDAIKRIARELGINPKYINFAGTKDKIAVTTQFITIKGGKEKNLSCSGSDSERMVSIEYVGKTDEQNFLGNLIGNEFEITVRNLPTDFRFSENKVDIAIPNYFGEQRFGAKGNNHLVGLNIFKKNFMEAANLAGISVEGNDAVGAFQKLHKSILKIYTHAFQSYVWNEVVSELISKGKHVSIDQLNFVESNDAENLSPEDLKKIVPLPGFDMECEDDVVEDMIDEILERHDMSERDFIVRSIPQASVDGAERDMLIKPGNIEFSDLSEDELNSGKKKMKVTFSLSKGAYATIVIKGLFGYLFIEEFNQG